MRKSYVTTGNAGNWDVSRGKTGLDKTELDLTELAPQVVLHGPLRSMFNSVEGFLSIHSEALRMSAPELRWFDFFHMPDLDAGVYELASCPGRMDATGGVDRAKELRQRPIKDCGVPHKGVAPHARPRAAQAAAHARSAFSSATCAWPGKARACQVT